MDEAVARARSQGFDPGDVITGERLTHTGTLLRWQLTSNAQHAGPVPFLIRWGDSAHPAWSAPPGLTLRSLHIEHPEPLSLMHALAAVGADLEVRLATGPALVARIDGPHGENELR
jgi:hypothetical protein